MILQIHLHRMRLDEVKPCNGQKRIVRIWRSAAGLSWSYMYVAGEEILIIWNEQERSLLVFGWLRLLAVAWSERCGPFSHLVHLCQRLSWFCRQRSLLDQVLCT